MKPFLRMASPYPLSEDAQSPQFSHQKLIDVNGEGYFIVLGFDIVYGVADNH